MDRTVGPSRGEHSSAAIDERAGFNLPPAGDGVGTGQADDRPGVDDRLLIELDDRERRRG